MLDLLARTTIFPTALAKTRLGNAPFVRKWLRDNQQSCGERKKKGDVCCNTETGRCGVDNTELPAPPTSFLEPLRPRLVMAAYHPPIGPMMAYQAAPSGCAKFNQTPFYNHGLSGTNGHKTGQHTFVSSIVASCTYTDGPSPGPCNVQCSAQGTGGMSEAGDLVGILPVSHVTAGVSATGNAGSTGGGSASCQGTSAGTVVSCIDPTCNVALSISASKDGIGATVSFPPSNVFADSNAAKQDCLAQSTAPTPTPTPVKIGGLPPDPCLDGATVTPSQGPVGTLTTTPNTKPDCSPIIIDLTGDGFFLTDVAHGVKFDIANTGIHIQIAWTANSNNAFLVLDRNQNGVISSGAEMFGNFTSQPSSPNPNGFLALAVYDDPANGGNGDGVIDARDAIYSSLRLWVDANHDGISQPGELYTLPAMGVMSISLEYSLSKRTDEFGNVFRYKAKVNQGLHGESDVGRKAYDVFLVTQ